MKALPRVSVILLAGLALAAILVPWISPWDYYTPDWALDEEEWDDVHAKR